jgi:prepilin-type N-terminal cleavage/methylation domain-containing protein
VLAQIRKARQEESGFTLIELLIVIVILGVLAGIVVFAVGGINNNSRVSACKADIKTVLTAEEAHYAQNGAYAATTAELKAARLLQSAPDTVTITITPAAGTVPADITVVGKNGAAGQNQCAGITL